MYIYIYKHAFISTVVESVSPILNTAVRPSIERQVYIPQCVPSMPGGGNVPTFLTKGIE